MPLQEVSESYMAVARGTVIGINDQDENDVMLDWSHSRHPASSSIAQARRSGTLTSPGEDQKVPHTGSAFRKVALAAGREEGKLEVGKKAKWLNYCKTTFFEPSKEEKESFQSLQSAICDGDTILYHFDPDKILFVQVDASLKRGFGVMLFHVKDDTVWDPLRARQYPLLRYCPSCSSADPCHSLSNSTAPPSWKWPA